MAAGARRTAERLLVEDGRTFADELGIDLARGTPSPLFRLLCASILLSAPIQARLALSAARELGRARLTSAARVAEADRREVWAALAHGRYLRKDRTVRMLQATAEHAIARWGGDLRRLRAEADGDVTRAAELLREFTGVGPTGAEAFLREVQAAWPEVAPFFGARARTAAGHHGLPTDDAALAALVDPADVPRLAAALVRSEVRDE